MAKKGSSGKKTGKRQQRKATSAKTRVGGKTKAGGALGRAASRRR